MTTIKVKGHEFEAIAAKDSFNRRATQISNTIISSLRRLGISADDVEIEHEPNAMKKAPASVSWWLDKQHLHYSHSSRGKHVDNLYVVSKVIELEVAAVLDERKTLAEFMDEFSESVDVATTRKEARVTLGLDHDVNDLSVVDKAYKDLARKHHPDTENGDTETFKEINHAHKILKRELL